MTGSRFRRRRRTVAVGWSVFIVVGLGVFVGAGVLGVGPASARQHPQLVVREGVVTRSYPGLAGAYPNHGPAEPGQCTTAAACDVIPLTIDPPAADEATDVLVAFTVTWADDDGNILNAALFTADTAPPVRVDNPGRNATTGLIKWTTGGPGGSLVLRTANPSAGQYNFTVSNHTGENRGYSIQAELSRRAASSGDRQGDSLGEPAGAAGQRGVAPLSVDGSPAGAADSASTGRQPDARYDGVTGLAAGGVKAGGLDGVDAALVALAAALLAFVGVGSWRTWTSAARGSWFRDVRLFWKLMAPFLVVIVVVGVIGTFLTARYLADRADSELSRRLVQGNAAAGGYLRDQEFSLLDASRFAANVQGLAEGVTRTDAAAVERALASVAAVNEDIDVIAALLPDGRSLASLTRTDGVIAPHAGERWSGAPPVRSALDGVVDRAGDKHAGLVQLGDGSAVLVVAAPVRTETIVGAVVVGRRLGPMLAEASRRSDASVAVYDGTDRRVATSNGLLPQRLQRPVADGQSRRERITLDEQRVGHLATPLELRDRRVGTLMVSIPVGSAFDALRGTAVRLGLLVALGLGAIVAIGALLSRYILRTVQPLLATNRALGRGELSARAPVHGKDELGELAEGFNQMAEELEASYQQLERRVSERTEELQRLYRAREEFFASVSHELRTPLFAILANSELLSDPALAPNDPEEQAAFIDTIHTSAQQLVANVNDILDLAKAEAATVDIRLLDIDPGEVLDEVTASIAALGRREDVAVELDRPRRLPRLHADRDRLVQVLLNLGSNAVKYTPPGGRVTISARTDDDTFEIAVRDTGLGIPADVGDRVFEPYYVVGPVGHGGQPTTGLGLAITKRLVSAHGGTIGYTSEPGRGTTFTVRLPLRASGRRRS